MSFQDLDRAGLRTPPLTPQDRVKQSSQPQSFSWPIDTQHASPPSRQSSSSPLSQQLPVSMVVTSGNARDSIGLGHHLKDPVLFKKLQANIGNINSSNLPSARVFQGGSQVAKEQQQPRQAEVVTTMTSASSSTSSSHTALSGSVSSSVLATTAPTRHPMSNTNDVDIKTQTGLPSGDLDGLGGRNGSRPTVELPRSLLDMTRPKGHSLRQHNATGSFSTFHTGQSTHVNGETLKRDTVLIDIVDQECDNYPNSRNVHDHFQSSTSYPSSPPSSQQRFSGGSAANLYPGIESDNSNSKIKFVNNTEDYDLTVRVVSQTIFNISSNIFILNRLVPCLGQYGKDTLDTRESLKQVLETTQGLVKTAHGQLKMLAKHHQQQAFPSPISAPTLLAVQQSQIAQARKQTFQRLSKDLGQVTKSFQDLSKAAIEAERLHVTSLKRLSRGMSEYYRRSDLMDLSAEELEQEQSQHRHLQQSPNLQHSQRNSVVNIEDWLQDHGRELSNHEQAQLRQILLLETPLEHQEAILQEREQEIDQMEHGLVEVMQVMQELGIVIADHREELNFLHDNVLQVRSRVLIASEELQKAAEYQRKWRENSCFLVLIGSSVVAIVLLALT